MPELPDLSLYVHALEPRIVGKVLHSVSVHSPSVLRTVEPPLEAAQGRRLTSVRLLGKRLVFELSGELFLVLHLMISGRLHWKPSGSPPRRKFDSALFTFDAGTLLLTEAGSRKRASLHLASGKTSLNSFDRGGIDPLSATPAEFQAALCRRPHTLKRALIDPSVVSGIGNAYSDEILHHARLSPLRRTTQLTDDDCARLAASAREVLLTWIERLREASGDAFPEKVTAFRSEMAVHGKFGKPCPVCRTAVQRIRYAENECNYCPRCQTQGRILSDRSLARLLKDDWPRTIEELEARQDVTN